MRGSLRIVVLTLFTCASTSWSLHVHGPSSAHRSCTPEPVEFPGRKLSAAEAKARSSFLRAVGPQSPAEAFFTTRHRCCQIPDVTLEVPKSIRLFDWYQTHEEATPDNFSHPSPTTIFCRANVVKACMKFATARLTKLGPSQKRVLAIGGEDTHLSKAKANVEAIIRSGLFSRILFEAKDIEMQGVGTFPIGLNDMYIHMNGPENVRRAVTGASLQKKDRVVLAAWGKLWGYLDQTLPSRKEATRFVESSCFVNRSMVDQSLYWSELSRHRFLLAPSGNGVQTPKLTEALLVLTIPIVQRNPAFVDLASYGWPLAIVDHWDEITPAQLQRWHAELSPKLELFRLKLTSSGPFQGSFAW